MHRNGWSVVDFLEIKWESTLHLLCLVTWLWSADCLVVVVSRALCHDMNTLSNQVSPSAAETKHCITLLYAEYPEKTCMATDHVQVKWLAWVRSNVSWQWVPSSICHISWLANSYSLLWWSAWFVRRAIYVHIYTMQLKQSSLISKPCQILQWWHHHDYHCLFMVQPCANTITRH